LPMRVRREPCAASPERLGARRYARPPAIAHPDSRPPLIAR
jgi:hypothetical protein